MSMRKKTEKTTVLRFYLADAPRLEGFRTHIRETMADLLRIVLDKAEAAEE